ncbi:unnamed protein product [Moneuplotes crassus]|uniref:Uncharacterized protein n=1 Tax=Euplotes crassus TaxID=5936 RepID=A0AAD1X874_EUPCR|nr:unnamed protein product [Moneuplotes crassus]
MSSRPGLQFLLLFHLFGLNFDSFGFPFLLLFFLNSLFLLSDAISSLKLPNILVLVPSCPKYGETSCRNWPRFPNEGHVFGIKKVKSIFISIERSSVL